MRKSLKKLLSFVLVIGIMAGSFIFAMPALADSGVVLETNGGTLASTAPIEAGAPLPNYTGITRGDYTFGGWFLNADLTGAQQFTAEANKTYYARWVIHDVTVTDFEGWDNSTFASNVRVYNEYHTNKSAYAQLNTNSANAYSGSNSAKIYVSWDGNSNGDVIDFGDNDTTGRWYNDDNIKDGVCFWMTTDHAVTFKVQYWNNYVCTVSVAAGTHIITIPDIKGYNYNFKLVFQKPNGPRPTVYIDDFGSFTDVPYTPPVVEVPATYETNGGTFNAGYTVPTAAGATLPTYENITREDCVFGGWYTEADFSGNQKFVVENNAKYYARWVAHDVNVTNFESYTNETFTTSGNPKEFNIWKYHDGSQSYVALNSDSAKAYSGNNSAEIFIDSSANGNLVNEFGDGTNLWWPNGKSDLKDGICFWISTDNPVTFFFQNAWGNVGNSVSVEITLPANSKNLITLPALAGSEYDARFMFRPASPSATVHIDDIGVFTDVPYIAPTPVTLNTNGGTLADPDVEYFAQDTLPTEITKANAIFTGWYDNAELTGTPVTIAQNNGVYYASWIEDIKVIDSFESGFAAPWKEFNMGGNAISSLTAADGALKVVTKNINSNIGYSGDQFDAICYDNNLGTTITSEGMYAIVRSEYEAEIRFTINPNYDSTWGTKDHNYHKKGLTPGTHYIKIPWSAFGGEAFGHDDIYRLGLSIKGIWSGNASLTGTLYIEEVGVYGVEVKPSYGIATPGAAGLFFAEQSENSGITITDNSAVYSYEEGGPLYTAFRVFGTYTAPDKNGAPDFGKVVVGEGDVREIASRHVMLGYKTEPTIEKNYVMTNAKGDFDKCWSFERNPDGTWKVTYSLLLKDIPEEYAATAFNVKSAIVTKDNTTIYSGEMVEGVSAQAIFDKIEGDKPVWFFN